VWRPRSGGKLDLAPAYVLAASFAAEIGSNVTAAAGVKGESWWAAGRGVVAVAPFDQHDEGGSELAALVGEDVLGPAGALRVWNALEHAFVAQQLEPVGEDVGRDPELVLEILEALDTQYRVAKDQKRPALTDDF
jgi:hypothetical protein